jgi:hypothetical protein
MWKEEYSKYRRVDSKVDQEIFVEKKIVQQAKCYDADNCVIAKVFQDQLGYGHATVHVTKTFVYDENAETRTEFFHGRNLQEIIRNFDSTKVFPAGRYRLNHVSISKRKMALRNFRKKYAKKIKAGHIPKSRVNKKTTHHVRSLNR